MKRSAQASANAGRAYLLKMVPAMTYRLGFGGFALALYAALFWPGCGGAIACLIRVPVLSRF